jgi:uncharacterized repeat protein (TIGR03803 family)
MESTVRGRRWTEVFFWLAGGRSGRSIGLLCALTTLAMSQKSVINLANFNGTNGSNPVASFIQGTDGNFYGTTYLGGANQTACGSASTQPCGTVFKFTPPDTLTTIYNFCSQPGCADGKGPVGSLIQTPDGSLYGTTVGGGANASNCPISIGCGTLFKISPSGTLTTLYSFCARTNCVDGAAPFAALLQGMDGNFYGTTGYGGTGTGGTCLSLSCGTAFKITPQGTLSTLYNFCSQTNCGDGSDPMAPMVQGTDGNFYGTTSSGGGPIPASGTVFKLTGSGALTTLHVFCPKASCDDGQNPNGLVQASDGNFYGTTLNSYPGGGEIFRITPHGGLTVLFGFSAFGTTNGYAPFGTLIQATDGNLYGTTAFGGSQEKNCPGIGGTGCGTVFKVTLSGQLTLLSNFCSQPGCTDGSRPDAGLIQATNGNVYGTTYDGGTSNLGTIFGFATRLGPFVETNPSSGRVGAKVVILGNNLTGTTSVSFNGTAATFTASSSEIKTTVPSGATTGTVQVTTPSGTLSSNVAFRVTPQVLSFSPTSGPVGTSVIITGESLTGASVVGFGGVAAASFTVNSDTQITASVPAGAMTGPISVIAPGGSAQSATSFTVTP